MTALTAAVLLRKKKPTRIGLMGHLTRALYGNHHGYGDHNGIRCFCFSSVINTNHIQSDALLQCTRAERNKRNSKTSQVMQLILVYLGYYKFKGPFRPSASTRPIKLMLMIGSIHTERVDVRQLICINQMSDVSLSYT